MNYQTITKEQLLNDIPLSLAQSAHAGTSHVPEKRGEQERESYASTLAGDYARLAELATTEEKREVLAREFDRYRAGFRARYVAELSAKSRCISPMITGPANFPTRRNQKRSDTADRRTRELLEFRDRALTAIRRALCPELAPIKTSDPDASDRLGDKIRAAETRRDAMKAANAAARKAGQPQPHEPWELSNLGANIRRMKERQVQVGQVQATAPTVAQGARARLEDCPPDNRVRLFFPGKPDEATRTRLKQRGFRWTPTLGCWQAYRNPYTLDFARTEAGVGNDAPAAAAQAAPAVTTSAQVLGSAEGRLA